MAFQIGQKVVCVNAKPLTAYSNMNGLKEGAVYTVRWCGDFSYCGVPFGCGIRLDEIIRGPEDNENPRGDTPYLAARFRPLVESKTDISIFKRMLTPKQTEPAA